MSDPRGLARTIVEECWGDVAGLDRMAAHLAPRYVHHTAFGDWTFEQFRGGMEWVESVFTERRYRVEHAIVEGPMVGAYIVWSATRRSDRTELEGRGAYHCRVEGGLIHEDWGVFFPTG